MFKKLVGGIKGVREESGQRSQMKLVLASKNKDKLRKLTQMLSFLKSFEIVSLTTYPDALDVVENGKTFEENAIKKAIAIANFTRQLTIGDDSGLEVVALNGEPGIYSARYASNGGTYKDNCDKLLKNMQNIPDDKRGAQFKTVVVIAVPGRLIGTCEGTCQGTILHEMRGSHGFGYDPVFYYPPLKRTFAEMSSEEKIK